MLVPHAIFSKVRVRDMTNLVLLTSDCSTDFTLVYFSTCYRFSSALLYPLPAERAVIKLTRITGHLPSGVTLRWPMSSNRTGLRWLWFGPAVKYTSVAGAAAASLLFGLTFPGLSAKTPLNGSGFHIASCSSPSNFPVAKS